MTIIVNNPTTKKILLDAIKNKKDVLVLYHASWCHHCVEFQPVWESFIEKNAIIGASVESAHSSLLSNEINHNDVRGFPTLKLFTNGKAITYEGERTDKKLKDFVSNNTKSKKTSTKSSLAGGAKRKVKIVNKPKPKTKVVEKPKAKVLKPKIKTINKVKTKTKVTKRKSALKPKKK